METVEHFHEPREVIRTLQTILVGDKKRIGFLFGAGTSMAADKIDDKGYKILTAENKTQPWIPGVNAMTQQIVDALNKGEFQEPLEEIKKELEDAETDVERKKSVFLIENIISLLEQKIKVVGNSTLCGLNKEKLEELRTEFKKRIKELVAVHENKFLEENGGKLDFVHSDFASWILFANRKLPIEIFSTNYDYLFEIGFETKRLQYFDGFIGSYKPFFDPTSVEHENVAPAFTKLWKVHGSLGWTYDEKNEQITRSRVASSDDILIYPSILKYDDSRKQPYLAYLDRLSAFLKSSDSVLFVCGYSFGDKHINETIANALNQSNTHAFVFFYQKILSESQPIIKLARRTKNLTVFGLHSAFIAGRLGSWKLKKKPEQEDWDAIDGYFEPDYLMPNIKVGEKGKSQESNELTGNFRLVDFKFFVQFLNSMSYISKDAE